MNNVSTTVGKNKIRPDRLADVLARHLESLILEGSLRPGDRLLPERELAQELDVSRPTLREALAQLELRHLLRSGHDGTFVAPLLGNSFSAPLMAMLKAEPEATYSYLEFRAFVEGRASYFAALRASDTDRDIVHARFQAMEAATKEKDLYREAQADAAFHLAVYEASHNVMMLHVMGGLSEVMHQNVFSNLHRLYQRDGVRPLLTDQHKAVHDAVMNGDAEAARTAAEEHVAFTITALREIDKADEMLAQSLRRMAAGIAVRS